MPLSMASLGHISAASYVAPGCAGWRPAEENDRPVTAGAHAAGLAIAVVMALAVPRIRLRLPVPVASRRARYLAWRLRMWNR